MFPYRFNPWTNAVPHVRSTGKLSSKNKTPMSFRTLRCSAGASVYVACQLMCWTIMMERTKRKGKEDTVCHGRRQEVN